MRDVWGATRRRVARSLLLLALGACSAGPPGPTALDPANDACRHCRMAVSDRRFAAQIAAPGEETLFFDDLGCLRDYIRSGVGLPRGGVVYVADHRTKEWVEGSNALFSRQAGLATPMTSGLVAHHDQASRDQDHEVAGAATVATAEILGPLARPAGR